MTKWFLVVFVLMSTTLILRAQNIPVINKLQVDSAIYDLDQILNVNADTIDSIQITRKSKILVNEGLYSVVQTKNYDINQVLKNMPQQILDSLFLEANPLFAPLVLKKVRNEKLDLNKIPDFRQLYFGKDRFRIYNPFNLTTEIPQAEDIVYLLRSQVYDKLLCTQPFLFRVREEKLPDITDIQQKMINRNGLDKVRFVDEDGFKNSYKNQLKVEKVKLSPWTKKAVSQFQFSQNMASANWYQGGNSTMSVLGILSGSLKYDDKKNVQWENTAEWRMGFYSVFNDTTALRTLNTNEDVFKINSKLGVKAGGNWFYSGSVDFSTQFLNNYKSVSSSVLKSSFLTPVRLNVGVGLDYKYKKLFSLMLSPLSYKYIYANNITDVNPNLFGIERGKHVLSQVGSSFKAQFNYSPFRELQIDSRLSFYTNYQKVEIDWELVGNFTINRFLSTRISLNPRYDNTVILPANEKAQLQFKELISFGLTYKLID